MSAIRLVEGDRAGPAAVGILVPPLRRTFLIVRPRSLSFDLLVLAEANGTAFREFDRDQASRAGEALFDTLGAWSSRGCIEESAVPPTADSAPGGFHLRVHVGPFHLIACERRPGQPYMPLQFTDPACLRDAVTHLSRLLCPPPGVEQEFYLNTRNFQR
jgi:hypothetical protein